MKEVRDSDPVPGDLEDMLPEYAFDYRKARRTALLREPRRATCQSNPAMSWSKADRWPSQERELWLIQKLRI